MTIDETFYNQVPFMALANFEDSMMVYRLQFIASKDPEVTFDLDYLETLVRIKIGVEKHCQLVEAYGYPESPYHHERDMMNLYINHIHQSYCKNCDIDQLRESLEQQMQRQDDLNSQLERTIPKEELEALLKASAEVDTSLLEMDK